MERTRNLDPSEAAKSVAMLHLSSRPSNALRKENVNTVGEFIKATSIGLEFPALGSKSVAELFTAVSALFESITDDGKVDWLNYARATGLDILPKEDCVGLPVRDLLTMLPQLLLQAAEHTTGLPGKVVFQATVLERKPFGAVGASLGMTRQGVSLLRDKMLRALRGALLDDDYRCCRFHFRAALVQPIRDLRETLRATGEAAFTYSSWRKLLEQTWQKTAFIEGSLEHLLLEIFDYRLMPQVAPQTEAIVLHESIKILALRDALTQTARLISVDFPAGISTKRMRRELASSQPAGGSKFPDAEFLLNAIKSMVETKSRGVVRASLADLWRVTDQAERILSAMGVPMPAKTIVAKLNKATARKGIVRNVRNVTSALSSDDRFKPIGRLGLWTLEKWGHETRSIVDVAADILRRAKGPMTEIELSKQMKKIRPHSLHSVGSLMSKDTRFVRIRPRTWQLTKHATKRILQPND